MISFIYNFLFGSGFYNTLQDAGFSADMCFSFSVLAELECILISFYFIALLVYFFMCLIRKKHNRSKFFKEGT